LSGGLCYRLSAAAALAVLTLSQEASAWTATMATSGRQRRTIPVAGRLVRSSAGGRQRPVEHGDRELHVRVVEHQGLRWYDVRRPSSGDIEFLQAEFDFHPLSLEDVVSRLQRPKLDIYDDYIFVVMQFPVHNKATRVTNASEVDFFVGSDFVVTTHDGSLRPIVRMFDDALESEETRAALMSRTPAHLFYHVIDRLVDYCFPIILKVGENVERIEDVIFSDSSLRTVQEISIVRRDLIILRRIMKPQVPIIAQLEHRDLPMLGDDIDVYFGDIADHLAKIWDSLEDWQDVLEGLSATFDSLSTHRLNEVIKTLTVISVIMLPLTLITGIFGMNVPIPWENTGWSLAIIVGVMAFVSVLMLTTFRLRRWI
jgi:magnesium transporter